ncbi:MAG: ATP-binding protein [Candidatus Rokubacteria bacterium]|nr:ATP-binding protein [Candidatus Rokubacteria bacterium]
MRPLSIRARLTIWYAAALLAILAVVSALSYSVLRWSLLQQVDASLATVAQIVRETDERGAGGSEVERAIRELLGPGFSDQFFQFLDPEGRSRFRSGPPPAAALPLSPEARDNAARGQRTFETLEDPRGGPVRLLTVPVLRSGRSVEIIQVSAPLARTREALARYLTTLLALVPVAVGLGAAGGAVLAGRALRPVREMSSAARQITAEDLHRRLARRGADDEIDHLADTLNTMLAGLEAAFAQAKRFSADAAHELRTPLTALKGEMEVALRAARSPEEYRRVLHSGLEEVEHLICLVEDLLLFSRSAAALGPPPARVELEPLVLEALEAGARRAQGTGVTVRADALEPAAVLGDAGALRRALGNLVDNAVKYTPAGGKVELSLLAGEGQARIVVRDTGIGIDPVDAARIFDPFVRLDAARSRDAGGAGLGLALVRAIVDAHGGVIAVDSAPGAGSRFTISLPLAPSA